MSSQHSFLRFIDLTMLSSATTAMDDSSVFKKLLSDCQMPAEVADHIVGMGYTSIALMANAVGSEANLEEFVKHISPVPAGEHFQPFAPQTASIRRAVKECLASSAASGRT